jgi:hypothetical protein
MRRLDRRHREAIPLILDQWKGSLRRLFLTVGCQTAMFLARQ